MFPLYVVSGVLDMSPKGNISHVTAGLKAPQGCLENALLAKIRGRFGNLRPLSAK